MKKLWDLDKNEINNLKKQFYKSGYGKYLLRDIIGGYISIILLISISVFCYQIDTNIGIMFLIFSFIISFFVMLEYFRVEYILFEKYLNDNLNKKK